MADVQRLVGGGWFPINVHDADSRQVMAANSVAVMAQGGTPGTLPPRVPPTFVASFDRIVGGGWQPTLLREVNFKQRMLGGSVLVTENGTAETHSSEETLAYPKILFY